MSSPIDAVLFDYGMVLSAPRIPRVWSELAGMSGLTEADLEREYWLRRDDYDAGVLTGEAFWSGIGASVGATYSEEQLRAMNDGDVRLWGGLNEPMVQWVLRLHDAGVRTGILSNMGDRMAEGLSARFDWIGRFHHTVWSHALSLRKPDPAIYEASAKGLGVEPAKILFVDDKPENTEAAIAFGMQAIVYKDFESFIAEMKHRGFGELLRPIASTTP
ncbi:haloacid dehalogenase superfamily protein, subfamily IA, variant 3 with third motif having DD or ED [Terriglobus roseus DSM 18391]|uniref:Haloacid dehalogenase superfamily protein, subfamily IA, variant 3 with third motif having DD or ED n=1 Tax=Terriglobus roseus (strain DSM 18391 / NRRL B-41598 / KBS 63) TaxID=926566 RepID=I3ZG71_TERRK|nr:HAD family phosphatase [Terriglobus roseus]AFL88239.1 haloacid dehalogenase superfamily protein, subfamily IA, variant 3 with third motif having DD or ED [Terriglobus roseus DSM 18391]